MRPQKNTKGVLAAKKSANRGKVFSMHAGACKPFTTEINVRTLKTDWQTNN
jgi:hypothetical protein